MTDVTTLYPEFVDPYGVPYKYETDGVKLNSHFGVVWVLNKQTNKVSVEVSGRAYNGTGPARQWVNRRNKEYSSPWRKDDYLVLDSNIISMEEFKLLDAKAPVV